MTGKKSSFEENDCPFCAIPAFEGFCDTAALPVQKYSMILWTKMMASSQPWFQGDSAELVSVKVFKNDFTGSDIPSLTVAMNPDLTGNNKSNCLYIS